MLLAYHDSHRAFYQLREEGGAEQENLKPGSPPATAYLFLPLLLLFLTFISFTVIVIFFSNLGHYGS